MDFHAQAVPGAMKEALHVAIFPAGLEAFSLEKRLNGPVNVGRARLANYFLEGHFLAARHRVIHAADGFAGLAPDDRSRNVAKVTGLLRARKNIEDDGFMGAQGAVSRLMRIAPLAAAGDNRMAASPPAWRIAVSMMARSFSEVSGAP